MIRRSPAAAQRGLTLLELLVVLTILATLATVAITSTSGVAEQARYEATQRTLVSVREAILGYPNARDTDGTPLRTGFVADLGRLPRATLETTPDGDLLTLGELWERPPTVEAYAVRSASGANIDSLSEEDPEVFLGTGWRAPYVQFAPGENLLRDGWAAELVTPVGTVAGYSNAHLRTGPNAAVTAGDEIARIFSFGANAQENSSDGGYNRDMQIVFAATEYEAELTIQVQLLKSDGSTLPSTTLPVFVRLFGPNPDNGLIRIDRPPDQPYAGSPLTFQASTTAGQRMLRAYYNHDGDSETDERKSAIAMLMVRPGQNIRTLTIVVP